MQDGKLPAKPEEEAHNDKSADVEISAAAAEKKSKVAVKAKKEEKVEDDFFDSD